MRASAWLWFVSGEVAPRSGAETWVRRWPSKAPYHAPVGRATATGLALFLHLFLHLTEVNRIVFFLQKAAGVGTVSLRWSRSLGRPLIVKQHSNHTLGARRERKRVWEEGQRKAEIVLNDLQRKKENTVSKEIGIRQKKHSYNCSTFTKYEFNFLKFIWKQSKSSRHSVYSGDKSMSRQAEVS